MNRVQLIGDLLCPIEVRTLGSGRTIGKTIIAVSRGVELGTDWIPLVLHDRHATDAAKYLGEGSRVAVEGRLHSAHVAEPGGRIRRARRVLDVIVDRITYLRPLPPTRRPGRPGPNGDLLS